jgi:hypothetical protein
VETRVLYLILTKAESKKEAGENLNALTLNPREKKSRKRKH